jgi:hypothetical protein
MDWRDQVSAYAAVHQRQLYSSDLGLGIEFQDGCDAFWMLPGELHSTVPMDAAEPVVAGELVAFFERIDRARAQAIHVIRHHLASRNIQSVQNRSGEWYLEHKGCGAGISVGRALTELARDGADWYALVRAALKDCWLCRPPSRQRADEYLRISGPPAGEKPAGSEEPVGLIPQTIAGALGMLGFCRALERIESLDSPEKIAAAVKPHGRIGECLQHLAQLLPGAYAGIDLADPGMLLIHYEDDDDWMTIDTRSLELARRISAATPEDVAAELAAEYRSVSDARARVRRAIDRAAAQRGWRRERISGISVAESGPIIFYGTSRREVGLDPRQALTRAVRDSSLEDAIREELREAPEFAQECIKALGEPDPGGAVPIEEGSLVPRHGPPQVMLRELTAQMIAKLERFATGELSGYFSSEKVSSNRRLWEYTNPEIYDRAIDTWATMDDWVGLARPHARDKHHPAALLILHDAGDPEADPLIRAYFESAQWHHECSDEEGVLAWRYRHILPEQTREWIDHVDGEMELSTVRLRARYGDPIAARRLAVDPPSDHEPIPAGVDPIAHLRRQLLEWASTGTRWSPPDVGNLRAARQMGWADIPGHFEHNPWFLPGLLTCARREDEFDEPGILMAGEFLLAWSRLAPSLFLARLIATARTMDLVALADAAAEAAAAADPKLQRYIAGSRSTYRDWLEALRLPLAIAWWRCRPLLSADVPPR